MASIYKNNKVICILGMHRSGTSMISRILNIQGLSLGDESELMTRKVSANEKGHWENNVVMKINKEILNMFNGSWDNPPIFPKNWEDDEKLDELYKKAHDFVNEMNLVEGMWGFKEPRTCLTLPFWQNVIPNIKYVIPVRFPSEVASSLNKRNNISISSGILLYLIYWRSILKYTRKKDRIFTFFDNYFVDWEEELNRVSFYINLERTVNEKSKRDIEEFISPNLRHNIAENKEFINLKNITDQKIISLVSQAFLDNGIEVSEKFCSKNNEIRKKNWKIEQQKTIIKQQNKQIKQMQESKFWILRNRYMKLKSKLK